MLEKEAKNREINRQLGENFLHHQEKDEREKSFSSGRVRSTCLSCISSFGRKKITAVYSRESVQKIDHMAELLKTGEAVYLNIQQRGVSKHREREHVEFINRVLGKRSAAHWRASWTSVAAKPRRMNFSWICSWQTAKVYTLLSYGRWTLAHKFGKNPPHQPVSAYSQIQKNYIYTQAHSAANGK